MRIYTVLLSVLVHTLAVGFVVIAPILATTELPEPRRATPFVVVQPAAPPQPLPPAEIAQPRSRPSGDFRLKPEATEKEKADP
jgi:hypothetical protein